MKIFIIQVLEISETLSRITFKRILNPAQSLILQRFILFTCKFSFFKCSTISYLSLLVVIWMMDDVIFSRTVHWWDIIQVGNHENCGVRAQEVTVPKKKKKRVLLGRKMMGRRNGLFAGVIKKYIFVFKKWKTSFENS